MVPHSHLLNRRLRRLLAPAVADAAARPEADRYRKHFTADAHLWLLLLHALWGSPSLRQTHARLDLVPDGWQQVGLDQRVSLSQVARSSTSRPTACLEQLFQTLLAQVQPAASDPLLRQVQALDSTWSYPTLVDSSALAVEDTASPS